MDDAVLDGLIERNPCDAVPSPGRAGKQRSILTLEERIALFPSDQDELARIWGDPQRATAFIVLMSTGIRSGELRALRWRHLVRERRALLIECAVKHGQTIGATKSGAVRVVLLAGRTLAALDSWRSLSPFPEDGELIFCLTRGKPLRNAWLARALAFALAKAGINVGDRSISVHSFRHAFNTMARSTLPAETLRALLGHSSEAMTQHYDHPQLEDLLARIEGAAPVIEAMFDEKPS
jgi:integrase